MLSSTQDFISVAEQSNACAFAELLIDPADPPQPAKTKHANIVNECFIVAVSGPRL
jgi:hypothetical protein